LLGTWLLARGAVPAAGGPPNGERGYAAAAEHLESSSSITNWIELFLIPLLALRRHCAFGFRVGSDSLSVPAPCVALTYT
jgi:hypothetical protein